MKKLTMANEAAKRDFNLQSVEKSKSRTPRYSILVLGFITVVSSAVFFRNLVRSDLLDIVEKTETKQPVQKIDLTREAFQRVELTREEQRGSWIGDSWIPPPGWKSYSASELRNFYRDTSILWIGDSTARRAATTMYGILNTTNSNSSSSHVAVDAIDHWSVIDVNKGSITELCDSWTNHSHHRSICRVMPGGGRGGSFIFKGKTCLTGLELFVRDELSGESNIMAGVDIIIISLGIWEAVKPWDCKERNENPRSMLQRQNDVISLLEELQSPRRSIVWRTSGFMASGAKKNFVIEMNTKAMDQIEEFASGMSRSPKSAGNLTYVDWGGAIHPRSFGEERIEGDMQPHYGLEARYVLVQMITNQLASRLPGVQLQRSI
jgi:hypothetical protein